MCSFSMFNSFIKGEQRIYAGLENLRTATWQPTATRDASLLRGYPAWIRTKNNTSVSDRSAVNVAPFQPSEKLRCIHSITHFSAIICRCPGESKPEPQSAA